MPDTEPIIRLSATDAAQPWGPELEQRLYEAHAAASRRLGMAAPRTVHVVTFANEREFNEYLKFQPEHVVAVARPQFNEIVILRPLFFGGGGQEQRQVLVHEMAHLIIGTHVQRELPAWLNEGLAMLAAGEDDFDKEWRVMTAGSFGSLLPLTQLEDRVAIGGGSSQQLAYAQSLSLTKFLIKRHFPQVRGGADPAPMAQALADPETGPALMERLWDPHYRYALEIQWRREQRTVWSMLTTLTGGGVLWGLMALLFLAAYWRKKRMERHKREHFGEEEARDRELGLEPPPWEYEGDTGPDALNLVAEDEPDDFEDENERR